MQRHINAINIVYASAVLVIVVLNNYGIDSPIPGISSRRRFPQVRESIAGVQLTNIFPYFSVTVGASIWKGRGWTYQEALFARRKLYFTPMQAFFKCNSRIWHEDVLNPQSRESKGYRGFSINNQFLHQTSESFFYHLFTYLCRSLSHCSDTYNAFASICNAIYKEENASVCGLPQIDLDRTLLWIAGRSFSSGEVPRVPKIRTCSNILLPTWS